MDIPCWDDSAEIRAQALEESLPAFDLVYVSVSRSLD